MSWNGGQSLAGREIDWQIADFSFCPSLNQLVGPGGPTHLEPRTTAVLLELVEHAGEVRSRDELFSAVWDESFVGEAALTHCIWELRKAFGDDARSPRFIQTVSRQGYRLIAEAFPSTSTRLAALLWVDLARPPRRSSAATPYPPKSAVDESPDPQEAQRLLESLALGDGSVEDRGLRVAREPEADSGILLLFDRPFEAVQRAVDLQRSNISVRIALHMDEMQVEPASDPGSPSILLGPDIGWLKGLLSMAIADQTLLTRSVFELARGAASRNGETVSPGVQWIAHGLYSLEGLDEPIEVFEVGEPSRTPGIAPLASERTRRAPADNTILGWRPGPGIAVPHRPHWVLLHKVGEGGFGEVWLTEHRKTRDRRVFKFCFEAERLRALQKEVTLFRLLKESLGQRDDIVHLLDWNFDQAPYFIELEHTSAGSMVDWIRDQGGLERVPLEQRLELLAQTAEALAAAHSVGVLHKDVKPSNILIHFDHEGSPRARLGDFGIGRILDRGRLEDAGITVLGLSRFYSEDSSSEGTRLYMSPEALEGKVASTEADIYAFGVVLFQVVVGELDRAVAEGWQRDVDDPVLAADISQCVDVSPDRRPSARELADRLRRLDQRRDERERMARERRQAAQDRRSLAEYRRRRKLWLSAAALASAASIVVSLLAVVAIRARNEADRIRLQAEDLVTYMLGDLRDTLSSVGRLDAMDSTLAEVLRYLDAVDSDALNNADLARRAKALVQVGEVRLQQGRLSEANEVFGDASELTMLLVERDPERSEWRAAHADSRFWLGWVLQRQGDLDGALAAYEQHRSIYETLVAQEPDQEMWRLEVSYGFHNVAGIEVERREFDAALEHYRRSREIFSELSRDRPADATLRLDLADSHNRMGLIEHRRGSLSNALQEYSADLEIVRELLAQSPEDTRLQERLATTEIYITSALLMTGRPLAALDRARSAVEIRRGLLEIEPQNAEWRRFLAIGERWVGEALLHAGLLLEAQQELEGALQSLELLVDSGAASEVQMEIGRIHRLLAKSLLQTGHRSASRRSLERSLKKLQDLVLQAPEDVSAAADLAGSYLLLGDWWSETEPESAVTAWRQAAEVARSVAVGSVASSSRIDEGSMPEDSALLLPLAVALLRLGELERAEPMVEELRLRGIHEPSFKSARQSASGSV